MTEETFQPHVDAEVWARFPDYRALSVVVRNFVPVQPVAAVSTPVPAAWADAHIEAWHRAFKAFGSNPKRTAPSVDALLKRFRKDGALPSVLPVVDCYNSLSVEFGAPFGGEDIDCYAGLPRLVAADGSESFATMRDGAPVSDPPDKGEIVWRDDEGVTCRRWNWRQCRRTGITAESRNLWFVIDRLPPMEIADLERAGEALVRALLQASPASTCSIRLLQPSA